MSRPVIASATLATVADALHSIMYAIWLGGIIMIGALVAPVVAQIIHHPPVGLDPSLLKLTLTAGVIGESLRRFNFVCYVAGTLMLVSGLIEIAVLHGTGRRLLTFIRVTVTAILLALAFYLGGVLVPRMDMLLSQQNMAMFDSLHKQYENIVVFYQTPLLLAIPILNALRTIQRSGS